MTDPDMADATYIEPIDWRVVERIIERERPGAILPTMGGQTALNCALDLDREGVLSRYGVEMIGATPDAIDMAEDRERFRRAMVDIGLSTTRSLVVHDLDEARAGLDEIGFPCIIRPSFTMGGSGGGIAYNRDEFDAIVSRGLSLSRTNEVQIEVSILGWKEYETEVVRDRNDNVIIVCSIENLDPVGVHTGDSITVAPVQTLTDKEYQLMRNASIAILRKIGVETGGSNVQFAVNPANGDMIVIEMNPRVSRSSALASKATGFPIARVAAKLAVGYTLDELGNEITGGATPASFEPTIDYVVTKVPRFTFEKFPSADNRLTTQMKSVGEVMAIGRTFSESLQKALRGLEIGVDGLDEVLDPRARRGSAGRGDRAPAARAARATPVVRRRGVPRRLEPRARAAGDRDRPVVPRADRAARDGRRRDRFGRDTGLRSTSPRCGRWKRLGFGDARIAALLARARPGRRRLGRGRHGRQRALPDTAPRPSASPASRRRARAPPGARRRAGLQSASTRWRRSSRRPRRTCTRPTSARPEADPTARDKIMVLGGGPNRIGQGIEFDYCCVHAALALRDDGYETIMVNCNPTRPVSTDFDTSDRLYFEPLTLEDVLEIVRGRAGRRASSCKYGGQTPLKLSA